MKKIILAITGILIIFFAVSGCTLQDETVSIEVTNKTTIETNSTSVPYIGTLNLTVENGHSEKISVNQTYFQLTGQYILSQGTKPRLPIIGFAIRNNGSEMVEQGESRDITITHVLHENVRLLELSYQYKDIEIVMNLSEKDEGSVVVTPSFFKTNYFIVVIVLVFGLGLALVFLGRGAQAPSTGKNQCRFCLKDLSDVPEEKRFYCKKWKSRTKRCGEGPFCSKEHLEYHWEDVSHEN